jgi:hypothetical protein
MVTLATINAIKFLIAVFASYFPTVAISGFFAAWVAKKFGDHTAEDQGLLTLNPIEHTRLFGLLVLLMTVMIQLPFIIAFGRQVPINEHYINGRFRKIKYLIALWAKPIANLFLCFVAVFAWVLFWKLIVIPYQVAKNYPAFLSAVQLLYVVFRQINIVSLMLEFIFGLVFFIMSFIFPQVSEESVFVIFIVQIYLLLLSWYFIAPYIHYVVMLIETLFSYFLAYLVGF